MKKKTSTKTASTKRDPAPSMLGPKRAQKARYNKPSQPNYDMGVGLGTVSRAQV